MIDSLFRELLTPLLGVAEVGANRLLAMDAGAMQHCAELQGRIIAVELSDLERSLYFHPGASGIRLSLQAPPREPDAHIRGRLSGLINLSAQQDKVLTSIQERIEISGDARVAQKFQKILSELDIDWEEQLSAMVGDVAAFRIAQAIRQLQQQTRNAFDSLTRSGREYLQEETRQLPTQVEFEAFSRSVSGLRNDVERLEALLNHKLSRRS
jgi:ubiquinone biosynthesis protein UbiJ